MNDKGINQLLRNQFIAEADEHLTVVESVLLHLEKDLNDPVLYRDVLRALHSLKGISGVILSLLDQSGTEGSHYLNGFHTLSHLSESLLQKIRDDVSEGPSSLPLLFEGLDTLVGHLDAFRRNLDSGPDDAALIERIKKRLEDQHKPLGGENQKNQRQSVFADMVQQNILLLETGIEQYELGMDTAKVGNLFKRAMSALKKVADKEAFSWLSSFVFEWENLLQMPGELDLTRLKTTIPGIKERMNGPRKADEKSDVLTVVPQSKDPRTAVDTAERLVRLSQEKIDEFMNLIGELSIQSNFLQLVSQDLDQKLSEHEDMGRLKTVSESIAHLSDELQGSIMSVRLLPLSLVFSRFPRMVRDWGRKLGKDIHLSLSGDETVIDKNMIEKLQDPLMHMVRNAIDHGIEPPEERLASGKTSTGTIVLKASNQGQKVMIEISDDGRGLDKEKIIKHAVKLGVHDETALEKMEEQQLFQFLFSSGFSLSETVNELSGRGVGLDVVRNNIVQLGGMIEIDSQLGKGTRFSIQLPLTMAVGKGLLVESGGQKLYIPVDVILETMPFDPASLFSFKGKEAVLVREQILRAYRLRALLGQAADESEIAAEDKGRVKEERRLLVLEVNGRRMALVVDSCFQESEYLIKPLQGLVEEAFGFSGAMITAEGNVILLLDMAALLIRYEGKGQKGV